MYRLSSRGFIDASGNETAVLELDNSHATAAWQEKQLSSMEEYLHQSDSPPPEPLLTLYRLFGAYIASALYGKNSLRILDVGCGIGCDVPPYIAPLVSGGNPGGHLYVGLDPIRHNAMARRFPFICGRVEDLSRALDAKFDAFVFSTTLDHFEDLGAVARAVKQVAAERAIALFWIGLHDTPIVAEQIGGMVFRRLFASLAPATFGLRYARAALQMLRTYASLRERQARLDTGAALDNLHFHYFTEANMGDALRRFGEPRDLLRIPATNHLFATVAMG